MHLIAPRWAHARTSMLRARRDALDSPPRALVERSASALASRRLLAETADEFVARLNKEFADIGLELNAAGWTQATYITVDTELLSARANERFLAAFSKAVEEAKKFEGTADERGLEARRSSC